VLPSYRELIGKWLKKLCEEEIVVKQNDTYVISGSGPEDCIDSIQAEGETLFADAKPLLAYFIFCGQKLTEILTGTESPLETLFPDGSLETTKFLYRNWAVVRYFNSISRAIVQSLFHGRSKNRRLRIIEIGAGTGGTTSTLLPILPAAQTDYFFTDVSDLFLGQAKEEFAAFPFINYMLLDIEKPVQAQNMPLQAFDVLVAANVLHATRNLRHSLANTLSLLAPGGSLLLYEITDHPFWFEMTTGLIEGWQRFDDGLRDDHPLLTPEQWEALLLSEGFESVAVFPQTESEARVLRQSVIIARKPAADKSLKTARQITHDLQLARQNAPAYADDSEKINQPDAATFRSELLAKPQNQRRDYLADYIKEQVVNVLRMGPSQPVGLRDRLMDMGLDSLMAVELRNKLREGLGLEEKLPATIVFDYPTIEAMSDYIAPKVLGTDDSEPAEMDSIETESEATNSVGQKIMQLTDDELEKLLIKKIENL
jgi:SAM-dependent methyltransferase